VREEGPVGVSPYSVKWRFSALRRPDQVEVVSPRHGESVKRDSVLFQWHRAEPNVERYWVEFATDSLFGNPCVDSLVVDTTTILRISAGNYTGWWRVRAKNLSGWGIYSIPRTLVVAVTHADEPQEIPKEFCLSQNHPNPFNPSTHIRYGVPRVCRVCLEVFDILGRRVATLVNQEQKPGYYDAVFTRPGLSSGVYLYRVVSDDFVAVRKMLILR